MGGAPPSKKKKDRFAVIVVEDDQDLARMVAKVLQPIADVKHAMDGIEALALLKGDDLPDLIVSDVMMPHLDGLGLIKKLKSDERTKPIPVILLTAKSTPRDVIMGINTGARSYLTKPFKPDELLDKAKRALGV